MIKRLLEPPRRSFFLFGARGTGKSTWARSAFPDARRVDLLREEEYGRYLRDPGLFGALLQGLPPEIPVVVDEVQRLPNLLNEVHRAIEERNQKFVLLGSSARRLRAAGINLLAGRASWRTLHPFLPAELGAEFDLARALRFGTLPIVWDSDDEAETLRSYVHLYLREEIQAEAAVRNLAGFARFLPIAALFHGQTINVSGIARDSGVARTTVEGYLGVLEETLLAWRLPAFEPRLRVRERAHPKLYWIDAGIVRAARERLGPLSPEESGALLEGWVANLLRAYRDLRSDFDEIAFWAATDSRIEVDFVVGREGRRAAIEVKAASRIDRGDGRGLRAIVGLEGLDRRIIVYRGPDRLKFDDGIEALPVEAFHSELHAGTLL